MGREIVTQTVPAAEARQRLGQLMRQVYNRQSCVIVEIRNEGPSAAEM